MSAPSRTGKGDGEERESGGRGENDLFTTAHAPAAGRCIDQVAGFFIVGLGGMRDVVGGKLGSFRFRVMFVGGHRNYLLIRGVSKCQEIFNKTIVISNFSIHNKSGNVKYNMKACVRTYQYQYQLVTTDLRSLRELSCQDVMDDNLFKTYIYKRQPARSNATSLLHYLIYWEYKMQYRIDNKEVKRMLMGLFVEEFVDVAVLKFFS